MLGVIGIAVVVMALMGKMQSRPYGFTCTCRGKHGKLDGTT
jgi:hypothetical protein